MNKSYLVFALVVCAVSLHVKGQISIATPQSVVDLAALWTTTARLNAIADNQIRVIVDRAAIETFTNATFPIPQNTINPPVGTTDVDETNYGAHPYSAIGKVHYTNGGANFACSGVVVGTNLVMTAGHCVSRGDGTWHRDWIFSPQYSQGEGEIWEAEQFYTFSEWFNGANYAKDIAFVRIKPIEGTYIGTKYTPLQVETDPVVSSDTRPYFACVGYPGNALSQTYNFAIAKHAALNSYGVLSSQAEGSAGSPWIYKVSLGSSAVTQNLVAGLTSYIATDQSDTSYGWIFSPAFDEDVEQMMVTALGPFFVSPPADEPFVETKVFLIVVVLCGGVVLFSLMCAILVCICKPKEDVLREW